jgi:hypothetical protein
VVDQVRRSGCWLRCRLGLLVQLLYHHRERASGCQYRAKVLDGRCPYRRLDDYLLGRHHTGQRRYVSLCSGASDMHLSLTRIQGAVNWFGEIEVVCSLIKFGWIFVVIISGIVRTSFHHTLSTT